MNSYPRKEKKLKKETIKKYWDLKCVVYIKKKKKKENGQKKNAFVFFI